MSPITTHVLDTALGRPASGVPVHLELLDNGSWRVLGHGLTDVDGRLRTLLPSQHKLSTDTYRITFDTGTYFRALGVPRFFHPTVTIQFLVHGPDEHYHVPLLLSPFGYSTYRGS